MTLHNRIRKLRFDKKELSQENLANALGVTRQTIYYIEKGKVAPSVMLALKMARYFNTSIDKVFYISNK